jgi:hypothetical protein
MNTAEGHRIPSNRFAIVRDSIVLRDPRGRSRHPSILPLADGSLAIHGPFTAIQRFSITAPEGRAFVESSRDSNPIHTEDNVVPGAMTAARFLLLPEVLLEGVEASSIRMKFRAFSRYDRATVNRYAFHPTASGGLDIEVASFQCGTLIADGSLKTRMLAATGPGRATVSAPSVAPTATDRTVRRFLESLRLDPHAAIELLGPGYPRAFLAALTPGEMVRLGGAGGLLNALTLEFNEPPPAMGEEPPPVEVESSRPRSSFRKILARVGCGLKTYCQGYATVLASVLAGPREAPAAR